MMADAKKTWLIYTRDAARAWAEPENHRNRFEIDFGMTATIDKQKSSTGRRTMDHYRINKIT